jgi:hypothetical protein
MKKTSGKEFLVYYPDLIHIFEPVYSSDLYVIPAKTYDDYMKVLKKAFGLDGYSDNWESAGSKFELRQYGDDKQLRGFIWLKTGNRKDEQCEYAKAAHECVHAAFWMMRRAKIDFNEQNDEQIAYLVGFLMQCIYGKKRNDAAKTTPARPPAGRKQGVK